jgi:hypothetical protein
VGECVVVVVLVGRSLSARTVEEDADADAQRFVAEEVAEELPVRIGPGELGCVGHERRLRFLE